MWLEWEMSPYRESVSSGFQFYPPGLTSRGAVSRPGLFLGQCSVLCKNTQASLSGVHGSFPGREAERRVAVLRQDQRLDDPLLPQGSHCASWEDLGSPRRGRWRVLRPGSFTVGGLEGPRRGRRAGGVLWTAQKGRQPETAAR